MGEQKEWTFDTFLDNYLRVKDLGKEVEGRVPDFSKEHKAYQNILPGDLVSIRVVNPEFQPIKTISSIMYEVTYNQRYSSVLDMINAEGLERVLPEVDSIEEGIKLYHSLPGYKDRIANNGIHAIGLGQKIEVEEHPLQERTIEAISMIDSNSIYFAHPVNYFEGAPFNAHENKESELIKKISEEFPEYSVYNPNQPHNQENYQLWKKERGNGMTYYFESILPYMKAGIALPFEDGMFGAGTFGEIERFVLNKRPAYEIDERGIIAPIEKLDHSKKLSVPETQKRVYDKKQ